MIKNEGMDLFGWRSINLEDKTFENSFNQAAFGVLQQLHPELSRFLCLSGGPGCIATIGEYRQIEGLQFESNPSDWRRVVVFLRETSPSEQIFRGVRYARHGMTNRHKAAVYPVIQLNGRNIPLRVLFFMEFPCLKNRSTPVPFFGDLSVLTIQDLLYQRLFAFSCRDQTIPISNILIDLIMLRISIEKKEFDEIYESLYHEIGVPPIANIDISNILEKSVNTCCFPKFRKLAMEFGVYLFDEVIELNEKLSLSPEFMKYWLF